HESSAHRNQVPARCKIITGLVHNIVRLVYCESFCDIKRHTPIKSFYSSLCPHFQKVNDRQIASSIKTSQKTGLFVLDIRYDERVFPNSHSYYSPLLLFIIYLVYLKKADTYNNCYRNK